MQKLATAIESIESRLVPVSTSLAGGLWTISLEQPAELAVRPNAATPQTLEVVVSGVVATEHSVAASAVTRIVVSGSSGADSINLSALQREVFGRMVAIEISGQAGNDVLVGATGLPSALDGGDGHDSLTGSFAGDTLNGGNGNDILSGAGGNDVLSGAGGNDSVSGGSGNDVLLGGAGRDTLLGGTGDDIANGQGGSGDIVDGGAGDDSLSGGDGNDILRGATGDDVLDGQQGDDSLVGDNGSDLLLGSDGADSLSGSLGRDVLIGGSGLDSLSGGDDEDVLVGAASTLSQADLLAMRTSWLDTQPYRLRVAALSKAGTARAFVLGSTVTEDNVSDVLNGEAGRDWFVRSVDTTEVEGSFVVKDSGDRTRSEASNSDIPIAAAEVQAAGHSHAALDELLGAATRTAIASGDWSDPAIWDGGVLPTENDVVEIGVGLTVRVDGIFTVRLAGLMVEGKLQFATDRNTQLTVDTLIVHRGGVFEMGTTAAPIDSNVTATLLIADRGAIDREHDVFALGRGLLAESTVSIHGTAKTAFATVRGAAWAGATRIRLNEGVPFDWRVGDDLVLAGTNLNAQEDEQLTLLGIDGDAVLVRPLTYSHSFPATTKPLAIPMHIHLANLTRNAVVRSESTELDRRGHVMFMHMDDVEINYAAFLDLGRTDKKQRINDVLFDEHGHVIEGTGTNPRGRYAVHFHKGGVVNDGHAATVNGSVVARSPGWGFTNHSSFVNFTNNVSYDVDGAGFVTEAGNEIGSFVGNLAIRGQGSGEGHKDRADIQDFGHSGDGFWFQGPGVTVSNNAASGMTGSGVVLYTRALTEWELQDDNAAFDQGTLFLASNLEFPEVAKNALYAEVYDVPVRHFHDNEVYGCEIGFNLDYFNYRPDVDFDRPRHVVQSVVENLTSWNSRTGAAVAYVSQTDIRNLTVIGRISRPIGYGVKAHIKSAGVNFENLQVEGFLYGVTMPRRGVNSVVGGYFNNIDNITNLSMQQTLSDGTPVGFPTLENTIRDVTFGTLSAAALRGVPQRNVVLTSFNIANKGSFENVFEPMSVILDFGAFDNQRAYFALQSPDAVVFPTLEPLVNPEWVGKTNQQLRDEFGRAYGDAIAPDVFATSDQVFADVGTIADRLTRLATSRAARISQ